MNEYIGKSTVAQIYRTFWSSSKEFTQLITMNSLLFGKFFSLCFILLTGQSEKKYFNAFTELKSLCNFCLKNIFVDFEMG